MLDFANIDYTNMTPEQSRAWSSDIVEAFMSNDEEATKTAAMSMTEYVRPVNREMGYSGAIITPAPFDESERWQSPDHDMPAILIEIEPDAPGAVQADFGYLPNTFYPRGRRMPMYIGIVRTDRIVKEVIELGAYKYNFRTVITDLMSINLSAVKDKRFMAAVDKQIGAANTNLPYTGKPNFKSSNASFSYANWQDELDIMRRHPNKLEPATVLINTLEISKFKVAISTHFTGTTVAEDVWRKGFTEYQLTGDNVKLIATIKDALVPENRHYIFAAENRIGRHVQMYEPTMSVKNSDMKISFSQMEAYNFALINASGFARRDYNA